MKEPEVEYVVLVGTYTWAIDCEWGPFWFRADAEECVKSMSSRPDIYKARIVERGTDLK